MSTTPCPDLERIFLLARQCNAQDVFLLAGEPVSLRIQGRLERTESDVLTTEDIARIASRYASEEQLQRLGKDTGRVVVSCVMPGQVSGCMTLSQSMGQCTIAIRLLNNHIPTPRQCGLPDAVLDAIKKLQGLAIFSGPVGSGKTTSMLSVVDALNSEQALHICTVEDPLSIMLTPKRSLIQQRQVGLDVPDVRTGIIASMSQYPDVLMVNRLNTAEDIQAAVTAACTGILVLTQVFAETPQEAIAYLVDVQPEEHKPLFRRELAKALCVNVSQALLPRATGRGRVAAYGVLTVDDEMRQAITLGKDLMDRQSLSPAGSQTLQQGIEQLIHEGQIAPDAIGLS